MRPASRNDFTIAIICALTLEADAVEATFDETYDRLGRHYGKQPGDANFYVNGRIGKHNVVLCYMAGMGKQNAASAASSLQVSYPRLQFTLVVGICGGAPSAGDREIFLGDVLISDSVIEYDYGKQYPGGFHRIHAATQPGREIRTLVNGLRAHRSRDDFQAQILRHLHVLQEHYNQPSSSCRCEIDSPDGACMIAKEGSCRDTGCDELRVHRQRDMDFPPSFHIGAIASADTVMKSGKHRDEVIRKEKVIGFEMEGGGVWNNISSLVIKGVCDYADSHKNKTWQPKLNPRFWLSMPTPRKVATTGLGGVGKTQVALELAYRMWDSDADCSIFWAYVTIAKTAGIQCGDPADVKQHVKEYFSRNNENWLFIFDNADDSDMWTNGNSITTQGHTVFTSRNGKLAARLASASNYVVSVPELDEATGLEFLKKALLRKDLLDDVAVGVALLEQLTFLPLAITQATSFINENGIALSDYLALLGEQEEDLIELLSKDFGDEARYADVQNPVAMTWLISFQQIQGLDWLAAEYLSLMACVYSRNVPQSFLPCTTSKTKMVEALGLLHAYSFISIKHGSGQLSVHRLVYLASRNWLKSCQRLPQYIAKAADRLNELLPEARHTNRELWMEYLPLAVSLVAESEFRHKLDQGLYLDLVCRLADGLHETGKYQEAETLLRDVVVPQQRKFGHAEPEILSNMGTLASIYLARGQISKGNELANQIIEICQRNPDLGLNHNLTLFAMNLRVHATGELGKLEEAEDLALKAMEACRTDLGDEDSNALIAMDNLARIYSAQERWKEAEPLCLHALKIAKSTPGTEDWLLLALTITASEVYRHQGRLKEAEELAIEAINLTSMVYPTNHPGILMSITNQALVYSNQRRWKEAEELFLRSLEIGKEVQGPAHPQTLEAMCRLAATWVVMGRQTEALPLMTECFELSCKHLGSDHRDTLLAGKPSLEGDEDTDEEGDKDHLSTMRTRLMTTISMIVLSHHRSLSLSPKQ
ncbi:hypothetical protein BJX99DRAFT_245685 [Aspergillus californicus]